MIHLIPTSLNNREKRATWYSFLCNLYVCGFNYINKNSEFLYQLYSSVAFLFTERVEKDKTNAAPCFVIPLLLPVLISTNNAISTTTLRYVTSHTHAINYIEGTGSQKS